MQPGLARTPLLLALLPITVVAQQASVVSVNPQIAARGSVVTVTLTAPPKDAKTVKVLLDAIEIPVPTVDPNGNYRVVIPDIRTGDKTVISLGKHRVAVSVDQRLFSGNESVDIELLTPPPKLTSISPGYLIGGKHEACLTLMGQNFATDQPQDNQILFDGVVQPVTWGDKSKVLNPSTIVLCGLVLPSKLSVEVNVRQGERDTASGLRLTISQYGRPAIILFSIASLAVCLLTILALALLARKVIVGGTKLGVWSIIFLDSETNTYSLSKLQFFLWTDAAILTYSYLAIGRIFAQRADLPDVPSSLPGIIAIGAGTAIGSQFVTNVHGSKGAGPMKPGLADLITSGGVAAPDRVQMLLWTLVGVAGFCVATFRSDPWTITDLPQIGSGLMLLMGISSAGYLGGKLARKPGPVLSSITLTPAGPDNAGSAAPAAPAVDLSQPIAAALQTFTLATAAGGQPMRDLSANALSASQSALAAMKAGLDAARAAKADMLSALTGEAAQADAASRVLAAEFSELSNQNADAAKIETTRQAAELAQQIAAALQDLATGSAQAVGSAQALAVPGNAVVALRTIELRGRSLSSDATFEINGADLPFRMFTQVAGKQGPQIVSPEDDASATNMARALRLTIDPGALGPTDRKTYDSWFLAAGKNLTVGISNPDGQMAELVVTLPPGTEQAHT